MQDVFRAPERNWKRMEQLLLHLIGDYIFQSHWMATKKTSRSWPAFCHVVVYSLPFLFIGSPLAVLVICVTHFFMDRFRLARRIIWAKNLMLSPPSPELRLWENCKNTGYPNDTPPWLAVWLMVICDNTIHLSLNFLAIRFL